MFNITPVIKNILILNVGIFVLLSIQPALKGYFYLFPLQSPYFKPYQLISFMTAHASFGHLIGNMLPFLFLGPMLEQRIGPKKMTILYAVTGVGSGLFYMILKQYVSPGDMTPLVGASGATFGLLMALGLYFPDEKIIIFPLPIPIKIKYFVLAYGAYEAFNALSHAPGNVAHEAHLIGLALAFILIFIWSKTGKNDTNHYY